MAVDVILREVGPRDGLQATSRVMATPAKLAWIEAEHATGVAEIEVCSFVPARYLPQFADADAVAAAALRLPGLTPTGVVLNFKGGERGLASGLPKLSYVVSASESHNQRNARRSSEQSIEDFRSIAGLRDAQPGPRARLAGGLATVFGCTIEGAIAPARVLALAERYLRAGADELVLGDTVGWAQPAQVRSLFKELLALAGEVPVAAHFHDTRGLGLANALAAYDAGVRRFDATLAGLGGCPYAPGATGNVVMEDLAYMFEAMGVRTGIDVERLLAVRAIVAEALPGEPLAGALAKAGLPRVIRPAPVAA